MKMVEERVMNISYSYGIMDFLHYGHIDFLKRAHKEADLLIFGLVEDEAVYAWYGTHVSNYEERKGVLESVDCVDKVVKQDSFDPLDNLRIIHNQYRNAKITLYYGKEWGVISSKRYLESIGGRTVRLDYYDKLSPERILQVLKSSSTQTKATSSLISTKANTLSALKELLQKSKVEELLILTVEEFERDPLLCAKNVQSQFAGHSIVVRSSSRREDAYEESNAGHFASVLEVDASNTDDVMNAVKKVIDSYGNDFEKDEQILIQRQTDGVLLSGVVFTRDIQRNRPYYVINYDDSGSTDSVTSGLGGKTAWISYTAMRESVPGKWKNLMEAVWELEGLLSGILLDIEFAITQECVVVFQVRPLAAAYKFDRGDEIKGIEDAKNKAMVKYQTLKNKGLTCFSDMAFWNPAEIIGDNPKNLDYSIYREIITKSAWSDGLVPVGYRAVHKELMYRFGNKPYISVDKSFEALIPVSVPEQLATKLCCYYVRKLENDLSAHDKIEFEISHNCFDFSTHGRMAELMTAGFKAEEVLELENALKELTFKIIGTYSMILKNDQDALRQLEGVRLDILNIVKDTSDYGVIARSIHTLLGAIDKYGTPQFSRQARCAFIAKSLCQSLVSEGYISREQFEQFMSSIATVAMDYDRDYHSVLSGKMTNEKFNMIYGHLRAGTYNIRCPRYDQMSGLFSKEDVKESKASHQLEDADDIIVEAIEKALIEKEFCCLTGNEIAGFIRQATEQREYFKFIFTKSLSFAIELIKKLGQIVGISVRDLSYLELPEIYAAEYYTDVERLFEFWSLIIDKRQELYRINSEVILPAVVCSECDFDYIEDIDSRPNYITTRKVTGETAILKDDESEELIDGKIVVIEKADPGYDWIFSKGLIGLITKYGGAASHMAIRCAEFGIPAAIGCGASLFTYVESFKRVTIDCKHEKIFGVEKGGNEDGSIYTKGRSDRGI